MQNLKKFLSLALALVIVFGAIAPAMAATTADPNGTKVIVHKMKLSEENINSDNFPGTEGLDGTKYDGKAIQDLETYFGTGAEELEGTKFTYWSITKDQYDVMVETPANYKTVEQVNAYLKDEANKGTDITTTSIGAEVTLEDGYYWFVEHEDSFVPEGGTFNQAKAVPFGLELPIIMADGNYFDSTDNPLHLYPKNSFADKPQVDKDFKGQADPDNPRENKEQDIEGYSVGDVVPYEVKTIFQSNTTYKTAYWTDQMTEGLTFNQGSIAVNLDNVTLVKDTDYTVEERTDGFKLVLTETGLGKINKQTEAKTITISYTATLNSAAVVEVPESNDVTLHYGNNPSKGNTPIPTKPENGEITVTKTWAEETAPTGVEATFQLYNAQTGEKVGDPIVLPQNGNWTYTWTDLDNDIEYKVVESWNGYTPEYSAEAGKIGVKNHKENNPEPINSTEPKVETYGKKFVKIDKTTEDRLAGAEFVIINNNDGDDKGKYLALKTAEQITTEETAFINADTAYKKAIADYNEAIKAESADEDTVTITVGTEEFVGKTDIVNKIADLKDTRDDAFLAAKTKYTWVAPSEVTNKALVDNTTDNLIKLVSNLDGQFEITGLKEGAYILREIKAPEGYSLNENQTYDFDVAEGSYNSGGNINYEIADDPETENVDESTLTDAQKVNNTKVTIPQTGGIGTIIFTVGGIALMGGAAIAMKKNKEEDEE